MLAKSSIRPYSATHRMDKSNTHSVGLIKGLQFFSHAPDSPLILVDILRVGPIKAMVDSGTRRSFIREELLKGYTSLQIRKPSQSWLGAGGGVIDVVGEVDFLFRCKKNNASR